MDFEIEMFWRTEGVCVSGCGRMCVLFAESVSGSGVKGPRLQHLSASPVPAGVVLGVPTSP